MKKVNYHTHTYRCGHACGTDEEYVLKAIENGFEVLGFSDHGPWNYANTHVSGMRMKLSDFKEYKASILALKEKYKDQIEIRLGLELEYYPPYMDWLKEFVKEENLDYIIFGNHHYYIEDDLKPYFGRECKNDDMLLNYLEYSIKGMQSGLYSYLAHPDLFMRSLRKWDDLAIKVSSMICEASLKYDIPLEYNLTGEIVNRETGIMRYPYEDFWKIAGSYHCKAIIGFDAHDPKILTYGALYEESLKKLNDFGLVLQDEIKYQPWNSVL